MNARDLFNVFLGAANDWLCDGYSMDIRYIAEAAGPSPDLIAAVMEFNPLPPKRTDFSFGLTGSRFQVGHKQVPTAKQSTLIRAVTKAAEGEIEVERKRLKLRRENALDLYSEMTLRDRWFSDLHLQVSGARYPQPSSLELATTDNEFRLAAPPFDGLADACNWLDLTPPGSTTNPTCINIRIRPPVDLMIDECSISRDCLILRLNAQPKFDVSRVRLAVRSAPGNGLQGRQQVAGAIIWDKPKGGMRAGFAQIDLPNADSALAMLMIEGTTVRRQWFIDPAKARNNRYLAVHHFDKDLRMVRAAVLESSDSVKFEHGVAALLFLLGFTPSVQMETDAPDLIVTTPGGKLAIVECTIRTSDISAKLGKLIDRRGSLSKYLAASQHQAEVVAVLVCRSPLDQLPAQAAEAFGNQVILLTHQNLIAALNQVRVPDDPDALLAQAIARMISRSGLAT